MEQKEVKSSIDCPDDSQGIIEKEYVLVIYTGGTIGMKESPDGKPSIMCAACSYYDIIHLLFSGYNE